MNNIDPLKTAIIIVTYNALDYIKKCFVSLFKHTSIDHEIIVIDNASNPETQKYLDSLHVSGKIQLIKNTENVLWLPAVNQGLKVIADDTEYCLLLNSDIEIFSYDWLLKLQQPMLEDTAIGISGTHYNFLPVKPTYGAIDGCCYMLRRDLIRELGYFDENYPWNGAPFIYSARAWNIGQYFYHVKNETILHHHGKKSRLENNTQLKNRKVNHFQVMREAGLEPSFDLLSKILYKLKLFDINSHIKKMI
ncbi:MAG: glycosyltransferase [Candidatus Marinimicrobia bacterium]|nr:glycosyltransferase [Candidatus Neomarinimicrobiota bacterium]